MTSARPPAVRLRNVPTRLIARALERDGFSFTDRQGSQRIYRHADGRRVVIHYHRATDTLTPYVCAICWPALVGPKTICAA
jgi:predicted RNA binding protein YcfA (HicA-like mRNA interferase family)